MTKVKICGLTNLEDATEAVRLGAWAIGLIHAPSPRRVDPAAANEISSALRRKVEVAGVFVNPTLDEVTAAAENAMLSIVQLNGEEGPNFCTEVARRTGCKVIKAVQVHSNADITAAEIHRTDFHLFDTKHHTLAGGTGKTFDWSLLARSRSKVPIIVAGGLRSTNVAEAIGVVHPFGVDVASGVEAEPGRKDHAEMAAFFEAVASTAPESPEDEPPVRAPAEEPATNLWVARPYR